MLASLFSLIFSFASSFDLLTIARIAIKPAKAATKITTGLDHIEAFNASCATAAFSVATVSPSVATALAIVATIFLFLMPILAISISLTALRAEYIIGRTNPNWVIICNAFSGPDISLL